MKKVENSARNRLKISDNKLLTHFINPQIKVVIDANGWHPVTIRQISEKLM